MSIGPTHGQNEHEKHITHKLHARFVDTIFFEKTGQKGGRETTDEKQTIIGRLKEEQGSQPYPPMVRGVQP
jgi:hypothetical protein